MSLKSETWSPTRPRYSDRAYGAEPWQDRVGLALAVAGAMLLAVFFVLTAVNAGWVSDLHGSEAGNLSLLGRVNTYEAWLFPVSVAAIAWRNSGSG